MNIKIIYEDDDILVIDKPSGATVNKSESVKEETVQDWVEKYLKIPKGAEVAYKNFLVRNARQRLSQDSLRESASTTNENFASSPRYDLEQEFRNRGGIVHRLDKETSGILLIAKNPKSFLNLQQQFKERKVNKVYIALVHGKIAPENGEINIPVGRLTWNRKRFGVVAGGRDSVTSYRVISNFQFSISNERLSLLEVKPKTGRTHQIRVHLKYFGHPVFSDPLYAGRKTSRNDRKLLPRLFLHASEISFFHPKDKKQVSFKSDLPKELKDFLVRLD